MLKPALELTYPIVYWVPGTFFFRIMKPGIEATSPSSAEIKNAWSYTSTSMYIFTASRGATFLDIRNVRIRTNVTERKSICFIFVH
jgi:hypothetical protein